MKEANTISRVLMLFETNIVNVQLQQVMNSTSCKDRVHPTEHYANAEDDKTLKAR